MKFSPPISRRASQFWLLGEKSCGGEILCKMPDPIIGLVYVIVVTFMELHMMMDMQLEMTWSLFTQMEKLHTGINAFSIK